MNNDDLSNETSDKNISKLYQRGKQQPPAYLDDKILKAARDAVEVSSTDSSDLNGASDHKKSKSPFSGGWPATMSVAAVLIITVILVPLLDTETDSSIVESPERAVVEKPLNNPSKQSQEKTLESTTISSHADDAEVVMKRRMAKQQKSLPSEPATFKSESQSDTQSQSQASKRVPKAAVKVSSYKSNLQRKKTLSHLSGVNNVSGASSRSSYLATRAPAMMESTADAESMQALPHQTRLTEKKAPFKQEEVALDSISLVGKSDNIQVSAYGAKSGVMQPKKWLEKISQLLDTSNFEQAKTEVEEFRRCYPDEAIGESLLNRLSVRQ